MIEHSPEELVLVISVLLAVGICIAGILYIARETDNEEDE